MIKIQILTATLLAGALTLNAITLTPINQRNQAKSRSVSSAIAGILQTRGLDKDVSKKLADNLFNNKEELFTLMIKNIETGCSTLNEDNILEYLSVQALHRTSVELDSYSTLVNMTHKIKGQPPSKETLQELQNIAAKNALYKQALSA